MAETPDIDELMQLIDRASKNQQWFIMQTLEYRFGLVIQTAKDKVA
jgi:hypothetical protein